MPSLSVLVVDDEVETRRLLEQALSKEFFVESAKDGDEALELLERDPFDIVLLDQRMPGLSGLEVLRAVKQRHPDTRVVMVTAFDETSLIVASIRAGAEDYLVKPIAPEALRKKLRSFAERRALAEQNGRLRAELDQRSRFDELIGESPRFVEILKAIDKVAAVPIPVLVLGESGTGKELVARALHSNSPRRDRAFLTVNCAALHDSLLASELFGHVRGAFTDAREPKQGLFAAAEGGTLFMDEIGEISPGFQSAILRVLESSEITPIGSTTPRPVDVRIVAATNRELSQEVEKGTFRKDLFYRLWKYPIHLPALRERREDVPVLADFFLKRYTRELNRRIPEFSPAALRKLAGYNWPGNVRELANAVERAVILAEGDSILPDDLVLGTTRSEDHSEIAYLEGTWREAKERFERAYIRQRIQEAEGNVSQAARAAGLDRRNFRDKVRALHLETELPRKDRRNHE